MAREEDEPAPLFRPIDRYGRLAPQALTGHAVAVIVKQRAAMAVLDPDRARRSEGQDAGLAAPTL